MSLRDFAIRDIGCIACHMRNIDSPAEKHHLNEGDQPGRKRRGEAYTVGLCQWHHVSKCWCQGYPRLFRCPECLERLGPNWHYHKRAFTEEFGDGDTLLAYQNELIEQWKR